MHLQTCRKKRRNATKRDIWHNTEGEGALLSEMTADSVSQMCFQVKGTKMSPLLFFNEIKNKMFGWSRNDNTFHPTAEQMMNPPKSNIAFDCQREQWVQLHYRKCYSASIHPSLLPPSLSFAVSPCRDPAGCPVRPSPSLLLLPLLPWTRRLPLWMMRRLVLQTAPRWRSG